ncbi:MAG: hypothetical protein GX062_09105 [Firmicutes bacterium]|jgi:hypothetical protein|nr:hypothetical protein [Bacillota bacterium]
MSSIGSLFLALVAGYFGGWLALSLHKEKREHELRVAVEELISELAVAAEVASQRVEEKMKEMEGLLASNATLFVGPSEEVELPGVERKPDSAVFLRDHNLAAAKKTPGEIFGEDVRQKILALAAQGQDPVLIAQALKIGRGEVELVLNLASR